MLRTTTIAFLLISLLSPLLEAEQRQVLTGEEGLQIFERLKKLAGNWKGKSSKGWENTASYRVIARGSAILSSSRFKDEPEEGMASVIHMDGDRLLLTHYCEAGNQPRLVASDIKDDGRQILFEFESATNLKSRQEGHMDKVWIRLVDDDHFTTRWTWFQENREQWLEEILYERIR